MSGYTGVLGLIALPLIAYAISLDRRHIRWRPVVVGVLLQVVFAWLVLYLPAGRAVFEWLGRIVTRILSFTDEGSRFLFGWLVVEPGSNKLVFAVQVLPTIIFFSSLMMVLYHLGVMQLLVRGMARVMTWTMGVSGAESLCVAANVFVGQTEAPLVVRPYIAQMTRSELAALMTGGFATIAGGVLAAYLAMLGPEYARHLLAASVMSAPAAFVMAKMIAPESGQSQTAGQVRVRIERQTVNVIDAAATGAADGLKLALNVGAMLLAFVALIALIDYPLGKLGAMMNLEPHLGGQALSLRVIFGYLFAPIAWLLGAPWADCRTLGGLLGTKIAVNEFVAYLSLGEIVHENGMSARGEVIATYALCGFANFSSIAIQIGGVGGIAPERKHELAQLGLRAMIGGALASFMTAALAGLMVRT